VTPAMIGGPAGDQPRSAADADQLTSFAQMLTQIDEFLRTGDHVAHHLADFLSTGPGDTGQTAAYCLIDTFSFTALNIRRQAADASSAPPDGLTHAFPETPDETEEESG
jgi:hypothetical protein